MVIDNFVGGYTKAVCDIYDMFESMRNSGVRITKKSVLSFMKTLVYNRKAREALRDLGSLGVTCVINPKGEIVDIRR